MAEINGIAVNLLSIYYMKIKGSETRGVPKISSYATTWKHNCPVNWGAILVMGDFGPGVDSTSNINEYQESSWG
jgi:hypothetical protein